MLVDLSLRAKRLLCNQYEKLGLDESSKAPNSESLKEILAWCAELEIMPGKWFKANKSFQFDRPYIEQINDILLEENYSSIFERFDQDTYQSAGQKSANEKLAGIKPTHHLVLAAFTCENLLTFMIGKGCKGSQFNIELDLNQLDLSVYDSLVVVENRDSFNDWWLFKSYIDLDNSLVVYRGDKDHSTACKRLVKNWLTNQRDKPAFYFGDFDLAGLRIAMSVGYSHLLLPNISWLSDNGIKQHYPLAQEKFIANLRQECAVG